MLFNDEMVRAVRSGQKTQTRRVMKHQLVVPPQEIQHVSAANWRWFSGTNVGQVHCPYGVPGDELWVRECWSHFKQPAGDSGIKPKLMNPNYDWELRFRADGVEPSGGRWRPSIHMPRWASRTSLLIKDVRVERTQDITEEDAQAEGFETREQFIGLWDTTVKPGLFFHDDPWVWVIEFEVKK